MSASLHEMSERGARLAREALKPCLTSGARILEVGCGDGSFLQTLAADYPIQGVGVDPWVRPVKSGAVDLRALAAEAVDRLEGRFDCIFTVMSLHHFADPGRFFRAALAVAARRSRIVVVDWKHGVDTGVPERYFTLDEVSARLGHAGYQVLEAREDTWHLVVTAQPAVQRVGWL